MKSILCYGDSNTYGRISGTQYGRLPFSQRWTTILQTNLNSAEFQVIPEGLPGRALSCYDDANDIMSGLDYIVPCIKTHVPLDYILILLGTNDLKTCYSLSNYAIIMNFHILIQKIIHSCALTGNTPHITVISTPILHDIGSPEFKKVFGNGFTQSETLHFKEQDLCESQGIQFLDITKNVEIGIDGIHFSERGHQELAELLTTYIQEQQL